MNYEPRSDRQMNEITILYEILYTREKEKVFIQCYIQYNFICDRDEKNREFHTIENQWFF